MQFPLPVKPPLKTTKIEPVHNSFIFALEPLKEIKVVKTGGKVETIGTKSSSLFSYCDEVVNNLLKVFDKINIPRDKLRTLRVIHAPATMRANYALSVNCSVSLSNVPIGMPQITAKQFICSS